MDRVAELVAQFEATPDGEDDGHTKVEIILELEDLLDDPRALTLFATVIADPAEYDLARIECIKILQLQPPTGSDDRRRIGRIIAAVLDPEDDYLVRQYAAMSLGPYAQDPAVFDAISVAVNDDDIDVRHNALESVSEAGPDDRTRALLQQLTDDQELGSAAKRVLEEWR
ncbi:HEAT repeat domain-containing protein [Kutzneria chonburiensis]|uniref:HEAT repeat domain-containing protein n=1 Tax=Kutzneria chonburiensis TaxID=1483604 RepID=A0ABV6MKH6_9PSEU|nr:HEAT repeat domain-containing protein [Kutzneria chonburiensis]